MQLVIAYLSVLKQLSLPFRPKFYKAMFYKETRGYASLFYTAIPDRDKIDTKLTLQMIHYAALNAKSEVSARIAAVAFYFIVVVPLAAYALLHREVLFYALSISDASLYAQTSGSQLFLFLFLSSLLSSLVFREEARLAMIFCTIGFSAFLSLSLFVEYNDVLSATPDLSWRRFGGVVAIGLVVTGNVLCPVFNFSFNNILLHNRIIEDSLL